MVECSNHIDFSYEKNCCIFPVPEVRVLHSPVLWKELCTEDNVQDLESEDLRFVHELHNLTA